jgi:hypothetical protein
MMLAYQNIRTLFLSFFLALVYACQQPATTSESASVSTEKPEWLQQKILTFEKDKPTNPPVKIYSYQYNNRQVYFITSRCCDIPSELYSVEGLQLCQPDGGYSGRGDGKCTDFFQARTAEKLVWEDLRK